jgi:hypothetical protein
LELTLSLLIQAAEDGDRVAADAVLGWTRRPSSGWADRPDPMRDLAGFGRMPRSLKLPQDFSKFQVFSTGGVDLAVASTQNYRSLRKLGFAVRKRVDRLIATFCIEAGHWLLHNDHDFDPFEKHFGLHVICPYFSMSLFQVRPPWRQDIWIHIGLSMQGVAALGAQTSIGAVAHKLCRA